VEERARKTSIEQRGIGVITTSGALVTLLFGLSALATKSQTYALPGSARGVLVVAVALFLAASVLGLLTNWALGYNEVTTRAMKGLVAPAEWLEDPTEASRLSTEARVAIIESARAHTTIKAWLLRAAMGIEVLAVAALALAVGIVLLTT
jgi:nitroreductase